MSQDWKTVRIFISSTFRDMHAERDHLVRFVFPELRERCAKRHLHLVDVDLRWGVTEEDSEKGKILELCLDEIDRCRPFFVAILGERFGWVPSSYKVPGESKYDWVRTFQSEYSITALEIYHGALRNPEQAKRSFFYFRDPSFIKSVPEEFRSIFYPENRAAAEKLERLKNEIKKHFPGTEYYGCSFKGTDQRGGVLLSGLEPWGLKVLEDLWQAIGREYAEISGVSDELAVQRGYHEAFIENSTRRFIGRKDVLNRMISVTEDEQASVLIISGHSGYGKSALIAKFAQLCGQKHPDIFILPHFIGVGPGSTNIRQTLIRLCKELAAHYDLDEAIPNDYEELRQLFPEILRKTAAKGKTVILIDALNQLDESLDVVGLGWLPSECPKEVTLVVSTLSERHLTILRERKPAPVEIVLGALTLKDKKAIIRQTLWEYRKKLDERRQHDQMALLLAKKESASPLFLTVACEELRVFGEFEKVDEYLRKMPEEIFPLLEQVLERLEQDHGRALVEDALSLLKCSKQGLLETELLELLRKDDEAQMPRAIWAKLYRSLHIYLRAPGESGESALDFFHGQLAQAVGKRYLMLPGKRILFHQRLAKYFLGKADPESDRSWSGDYSRGLRYLPYHLFKAGLFQELFDLARDEAFLAAQKEEFPSDPHIPLETIHYALEGGARIDDAPAMAEFLLRSAKQVQGIKSESPLDALRRGQFKRAIEIADFHEPERSVLWHLLLALELKASGRKEEARIVLEHLAKKKLSRLEGWEKTCAELMLRITYPVDEELVKNLGWSLIGEFYGAISKALGILGRFEEAVSAAEQITDKRKQAESLIDLAETQRKAGKTVDLCRTLAFILEKAAKIEFSFDNKKFFSSIQAMLDDQIQQADFEGAILSARILNLLRSNEFWKDPPQEFFFTIAEAQMKLNDVLSASRTIEAAIESADDRHGDRVKNLCAIAGYQAKWQVLGDAEKTFELALNSANDQESGWRYPHLNEVAKSLAKSGFKEKANEVFSAALKDIGKSPYGIPPYKNLLAEGYKTIILARIESGITEGLLDTVLSAIKETEALENGYQKVTTLMCLAQSIYRLGKLDEAEKLYADSLESAQLIEEEYDRVKALELLGTLQAEVGEFEAAKKTAEQPFGETVKQKIAPIQAKSLGLGEALETVNSIADGNTRARLLAEIADSLAGQAPKQETERVFELALGTAREIKQDESRAEAFQYISQLQAKQGILKSEHKKELLRVNLAAKFNQYREWDKNLSLKRLASLFVSWGDLPEAMEATGAMSLEKERDESWQSIAEALAETGQFKTAVQVVREIENDRVRSETLQRVAEAILRSNDIELILETVVTIFGASKKHEFDRPSKSDSLAVIAKALFKMKNTAEGSQLLLKAREKARTVEDREKKATLIEKISMLQLKFESASQALETVQMIDDKEKQASLLSKIARRQIQMGDMAAAEKTADAIDQNSGEYRDQVLERLAKASLAVGDVPQAKKIAEKIHLGYYRNIILPLVASGLADRNDDASAFKLATEEYSVTTKMDIEAAIARTQVKRGTVPAALETIGRIGLGVGLGCFSKYRAITSAARSFRKSNKIYNLVDIVRKIDLKEERAKALSLVASELVAAGRADEGRKLFSEAVEAAVSVTQEIILKNERMAKFSEEFRKKTLAKAEEKGWSKTLIDRLKRPPRPHPQLDMRADPEEKQAKTLLYVGGVQAEAGELLLALETAKMIQRKEEKDELFLKISEEQAKRGYFSDAYLTSEKIESDDKQVRALKTLAKEQFARNKFGQAVETLKGIRKKDEAARILASIAKKMLGAGHPKKAKKLIAVALEVAATITKRGYLSDRYDYIMLDLAPMLAFKGSLRKALQAADSTGSDWNRETALRRIVDELVKKRKLDSALKVACSELSGKDAANALVSIARARAKMKRREAAKRTFKRAIEAAELMNNEDLKAETYSAIARAQAGAGFGSQAVQTAGMIRQDRSKWISEIAQALCACGDIVNFKKILLPGSSFQDAADVISGLLAQLYPCQAGRVAEAVLQAQ